MNWAFPFEKERGMGILRIFVVNSPFSHSEEKNPSTFTEADLLRAFHQNEIGIILSSSSPPSEETFL